MNSFKDSVRGRLTAGFLLMAMTACTPAEKTEKASTTGYGASVYEGTGFKILDTGPSQRATLNLAQHKMNETVCEPFSSTNASQTLANGLSADLYWLDNQCPRYNNVEDMIRHGVKSDKKLFFGDLNTPTRIFDKGFSTQTSETVKNDLGEKLIEYFALKFSSGLRIPVGGADGDYELALLSDDGAILDIDMGDSALRLINNDGDHEKRMGCSSRFVTLNKTSVLNFDLQYYQGPRHHIANVLMWRHKSRATNGLPGKDPSCNQLENNRYFNPDNSSVPQQAYKDLLARGWQVVPAEAFVIPVEENHNPCAEGVAPVISNFRVNEIMLTGAILSWNTDIPATTEVRYRNLITNEVFVTTSDNQLRTNHTIWLTNLAPTTGYAVEVIAVSADNGRAIYGPEMISTDFSQGM